MKKIRVVQFFGILLFVAYLFVFIFDLIRGFLGDYQGFVFSLIMALIGVNLLIKGVIIKSNSTLWFANVLIALSLTIVILEYLSLDISENYYLLAFVPILASVINLIVFKNLIYVKVIIINVTVIIPTILQLINEFNFYWTAGMFVISILIGIFICRLINFDKENI